MRRVAIAIAGRWLRRRPDGARLVRGLVALSFVAAALSGMAFFHPRLYVLVYLFGGGTWTRILHPLLGLASAAGCALLLVLRWRARPPPASPAGRHGALRRLAARCLGAGLVLLLVVTGLLCWRPHVAERLPVGVLRIAVPLHALAAVLVIVSAALRLHAAARIGRGGR